MNWGIVSGVKCKITPNFLRKRGSVVEEMGNFWIFCILQSMKKVKSFDLYTLWFFPSVFIKL